MNIAKSWGLAKLLLALTMLAGLLAACTGNNKANESPSPSSSPSGSVSTETAGAESAAPAIDKDEEYRIKLIINTVPDIETSLESKLGRFIKEKFNIVFEFVGYTGSVDDKLALMLAGGDYPEIVRLYSKNMYDKYLDAGALLPLDDLIEQYGPNFKAAHAEQIPYWKMDSADGKMYKYQIMVPNYQTVTSYPNDIMIRSDVMEALGWPELTTTDDYVKFFTDAKKMFPDQIGLVFPGAEPYGIAGALYEKGRYSATAGNRAVIWDHEENKFIDYFLNPYVKENFSFFNKLYRAGALDPESFTDFSQQVSDKANAGLATGIWYTSWLADGANAEFNKQGKPEMEFVRMPIMSPTMIANKESRVLRIFDLDEWGTSVITKNAKHPERIVEMLDYFATDEGKLRLGWGEEGIDYTLDAAGKRVVTEPFIERVNTARNSIGYDGIGVGIFDILGLSFAMDANGQSYSFDQDTGTLDQFFMSARAHEAYDQYGWKTFLDPWHNNKHFTTSTMNTGVVGLAGLDPNSDEIKLEEKLIDFRVKKNVQLILAESDEEFNKIYDEAVAEYNKMQPNIVIDKYNANYAELMKKVNP